MQLAARGDVSKSKTPAEAGVFAWIEDERGYCDSAGVDALPASVAAICAFTRSPS
ncbi:hypothetical protein SAMN05192544_10539 [Paraburkholderia hospita]|jgi:hypothetical protein|nr:hypothetical protein SAMN05192544_10539 [Paraburkholderia hospita]SKC71371.1 hypothetical protein SAMN05445504_1289 [Burkholderia sp. CF099]